MKPPSFHLRKEEEEEEEEEGEEEEGGEEEGESGSGEDEEELDVDAQLPMTVLPFYSLLPSEQQAKVRGGVGLDSCS